MHSKHQQCTYLEVTWDSQNNGTVSHNAGIAAYKKWDSQNNGTISQNGGITAYKK